MKNINKQKENPQVYIEGNNGGNYVKVRQLDDNRVHLEVGDCCVVTINCVITAEALSNALTHLTLKENKEFLDVVRDNLQWDSEFNNKIMEPCKNLSLFSIIE